MRIGALEIKQNGIEVGCIEYNTAVLKYRGMFTEACYNLYLECYQSSPSEFNLREFVLALKQEYPDSIAFFRNEINATLDWSTRRCEYAIAIAEAQGYPNEFLSIIKNFMNVMVAQTALDALSVMNSKCGLSYGTKVSSKITPKIIISNNIRDSSVYRCDLKSVRETFRRATNSEIVHYSTKSILRDVVLSELGVSDDEKAEHLAQNKAFFSSFLPADVELRLFELFLTGEVIADGDFADILNAKLKGDACYRQTSAGTAMTMIAFHQNMFVKSIDERCRLTSAKRQELKQMYKYVRTVYVTNDETTFEVANTPFEYDNHIFKVPTTLTGTYCLNWGSQSCFSEVNMLRGISGEYITQADIFLSEYHAEGSAIKLKEYKIVGGVLKATSIPCYRIDTVHYTAEKNEAGEYITSTLKPVVGTTLQVTDILTKEQIYAKYNVTDADGFYYEIRRRIWSEVGIYSSEGYLDLLAELICALKYFEAGVAVYNFRNKFYDYVDKDMYEVACYEASKMYTRV